MAVTILQGLHLTAYDRRDIATLVARGSTYGRTARKSYHVDRIGSGLFSVLLHSDGRQHALTVICDEGGEVPSWEEASALRDQWDADVKAASEALGAMSGGGPMGLTPDAVKFSPAFHDAKRTYDRAADRLRNLNSWIVRTYRKEARAHAQAGREGGQVAA